MKKLQFSKSNASKKVGEIMAKGGDWLSEKRFSIGGLWVAALAVKFVYVPVAQKIVEILQ